MKVTDEMVDTFKKAWEAKHAEQREKLSEGERGVEGDRTRAGLEAVAALGTHHKFGGVVDTGFPYSELPEDEERNHAITDLQEAVLVKSMTTVAIKGDDRPLCLLGLEGKLNHSTDTFEGYFILSWEFAGFMIGELTKAGLSAGPEDTNIMSMGIDRSLDGDAANG